MFFNFTYMLLYNVCYEKYNMKDKLTCMFT